MSTGRCQMIGMGGSGLPESRTRRLCPGTVGQILSVAGVCISSFGHGDAPRTFGNVMSSNGERNRGIGLIAPLPA